MQSGDTRLDHECRRVSCTDGVKDIVDSECADDADCVDNNGIYECQCPDGYSGDPTVECEGNVIALYCEGGGGGGRSGGGGWQCKGGDNRSIC